MALVQTDPIGSKILHQHLDTWWSSDFHCFSSKRVCPFYDISIYSLYSSIFILRIHTFYHVRKLDLVTYLYFYFSSMQAHRNFCMQKCCAYWVKSLKSAFTWAYHHITTHINIEPHSLGMATKVAVMLLWWLQFYIATEQLWYIV